MSSGLNAQSAAAMTPVLRPTSSRPSTNASGMVAVPNTADSDRSPTSPVPNTFAQTHASDVVERRRGLARGDGRDHVAEPLMKDVHGRDLVEPVALDVEGRETKERAGERDPGKQLQMPGPHRAGA